MKAITARIARFRSGSSDSLSMKSVIREVSLRTAIWYGLAISGVLIVTRLLCAFGAVVVTRFMSRFIKVADANPGWKGPAVLGWAGMRGVVSLAAALSIPVLLAPGQAFPHRNLILFITFIVILMTLVFQGLTLPWLIRKVKLEDRFSVIPEQTQELIIQKKLAQYSAKYLEVKYGHDHLHNEHLANLKARLNLDLNLFDKMLDDTNEEQGKSLSFYQQVFLEILEEQRVLLDKMNQRAEFDEELIRKYLALVDIEEYKMREKLLHQGRAV